MEVHARYTLMGAFALGVIALGFLFVYWLEAGGLGERVTYRIRFDGSVAGLAKGSGVLFNGVRVGEVTALGLDDANPSQVAVDIAVERRTPVRADTLVTIEFQGLSGAPTVSMSGGTTAAALLASAPTEKRRLVAEKNAGVSMTQAARDVLRKLDAVVTDNATPFTNAIVSIDKFATALARNSDKVDGIVAGVERLTGSGPKVTPRVYEIDPATVFAPIKTFPRGQMSVPEPTTLANLENERIAISEGDKPRFDNAQWPDMLPRVVQSALVRSFENAGYKRIIARAPDGAKSDSQLLVDIRRFQVAAAEKPTAQVELAVRIMMPDGAVSEVKTFAAEVPFATFEPEPAAAALKEAFRKVASQVVVWVCGAV